MFVEIIRKLIPVAIRGTRKKHQLVAKAPQADAVPVLPHLSHGGRFLELLPLMIKVRILSLWS